MNDISEQWEKFLDPNVVKPSLFMATMFITAFEILKETTIDKIRNFYMLGADANEPITTSDYFSEVLSKNKSPLYASLQWLREKDAIDDKDISTFEQLKTTRNLLAHQLFAVVTGQIKSTHEADFDAIIALLRKIGVWWIVNIEIPTNPEFDGTEINEKEIVPGTVLSLQILIQVASGNTELLEHWRKVKEKNDADVPRTLHPY